MSGTKIAQKKNSVFTIADQICAVLLALCPLLQHYVCVLYNAAITSTFLVIFSLNSNKIRCGKA